MELLDKIIKGDEDSYKELSKSISAKEKEADDIKNKLSVLDTQKKNQSMLEQAEKQLSDLKPKRKEAMQNLKEAESHKDEIAELDKKAAQMEVELSSYEELETVSDKINALEVELKQYRNDEKQTEEDKLALEDKIATLKKEQKFLENAGAEIVKLESAIKELDTEIAGFKDLIKKNDELFNRNEDLKTKQQIYQKKEIEATEAENSFSSIRAAFMNEQAGIIAESLEDGKPCPVCGSIEHPHIAVKADKAPSKEDVEEAELNAKRLRDSAIKANQDAAAVKAVVKSLEHYFHSTPCKTQ